MLYTVFIPWIVHFSFYWITCAYLMKDYTYDIPYETVRRNVENTTINFWLFSFLWFLLFPVPEVSFSFFDVYKLPIILILYEILFFYIHRAFHGKFLIPYHSIHHQWSYSVIPIAALDTHQYEYWFLNLFPAFFIFYITNCSYWFSVICSGIAISNAAFAHYSSNFHLLHHSEKYKHFGIFGIMDRYYDTL